MGGAQTMKSTRRGAGGEIPAVMAVRFTGLNTEVLKLGMDGGLWFDRPIPYASCRNFPVWPTKICGQAAAIWLCRLPPSAGSAEGVDGKSWGRSSGRPD